MSDQAIKLGFGLMRLPRKGIFTDIPQVTEMVDMFLASGGTYFDTAYIYPGSEDAIHKALVSRIPRDQYTLATKLNAMLPTVRSRQSAVNQLETSLKRTGAEYFDYYLLHAIMDSNVSKYNRMELWDFVQEEKARGRIRHCGFSFHGSPELLDQLLRDHPETEFVQLQINYADWENKSIQSRRNYEIARSYGKPIVIMEPVKGGKLANPPEQVRRTLDGAGLGFSYAAFALRFALSLDGVLSVLSGMSNTAQMKENLVTAANLSAMSDVERNAIREAQRLYGNSSAIPCTGCKYCMSGCPKGLEIPGILEAVNLKVANGQEEKAAGQYEKSTELGHTAADCIACRRCEQACPQHIEVAGYMKQAASLFEKQ